MSQKICLTNFFPFFNFLTRKCHLTILPQICTQDREFVEIALWRIFLISLLGLELSDMAQLVGFFYISSISDLIFWPRENLKYTADRYFRDLQLHADRLLKGAIHWKLSHMAQSTTSCRQNFFQNQFIMCFLF